MRPISATFEKNIDVSDDLLLLVTNQEPNLDPDPDTTFWKTDSMIQILTRNFIKKF